jgi:hypothetical protein
MAGGLAGPAIYRTRRLDLHVGLRHRQRVSAAWA